MESKIYVLVTGKIYQKINIYDNKLNIINETSKKF
jgi:hypothetical protein